MKNMFDNKTDEYTLKAILEAVDAFTDSMIMKQISGEKGAILNMDYGSHEFQQFATIHDGIDRLVVSRARADSFKDIITRTFGLFDSEMTELNAKRSDLLAKDNVKNYTYKHHLWHSGWYGVEYDNIIAVIEDVLYFTRLVIDKRTRKCSAEYMKELVDQEYKRKIDGYIETRLCGWKKDAYKSYMRAVMLGDGHKEVVKEFNFQDDWSISDMLDWEQRMTKDMLDHTKKIEHSTSKDITNNIKKIISDFNTIAKTDKEHAKLYADEIKRAIKYSSFLMSRLDEFLDATFYCLNTQREEVHKVLKGLLEYSGD